MTTLTPTRTIELLNRAMHELSRGSANQAHAILVEAIGDDPERDDLTKLASSVANWIDLGEVATAAIELWKGLGRI